MDKQAHYDRMLELANKDPLTLTKDEEDSLRKYHQLLGAGFFDDLISGIKKRFAFGTRKEFSPADKKVLEENKGKKIVEIKIVRTPLMKAIDTLIDMASGKKFKKVAGFDQLFHLFMLIFLEDGTKLLYEKNSTPRITVDIPSGKEFSKDSRAIVVAEGANLPTLGEFIGKAQALMGDDYWKYSINKLNCQDFIARSLQANGLLNEEDKAFIVQNIQEASKTVHPLIQSAFQKVTDLDAWFRKITGRGLENRNGGRLAKVKRTAIKGGDIDISPLTLAQLRSPLYTSILNSMGAGNPFLKGDTDAFTSKDQLNKLSDDELAKYLHEFGKTTTAETKKMGGMTIDKSIARKSDINMLWDAIQDRNENLEKNREFYAQVLQVINYFSEEGFDSEKVWESEAPAGSPEAFAIKYLRKIVPKPEEKKKSAWDSFVEGFKIPFELGLPIIEAIL